MTPFGVLDTIRRVGDYARPYRIAAASVLAGVRTLRSERERVAGELSRARVRLRTAEELMPRLREKLRHLEATLEADLAGDA